MQTATTISRTLVNQQRITSGIRYQLDSVNDSYKTMSEHRNRIDVKNHQEFVERHKALFFRSLELQADLGRSEALERAITRQIKAREHSVVAA